MLKNFYYNINIFSQISNIFYASKVLKEIHNQRVIEEYYHLTDDKNNKVRNPISQGNKLILKMPLPPKIDEFQIETYIEDHCKVLINTLLSLDLYGIVKFGKKIYINDQFNEEDEESDYGLVIITISPSYKKFFVTLTIYITIILSVIYYVFFNNRF